MQAINPINLHTKFQKDRLKKKKEIEANLCFAIFGQKSKIQNGRHIWGGEIFLKIALSTLLRYLVGKKFQRNRSISHG